MGKPQINNMKYRFSNPLFIAAILFSFLFFATSCEVDDTDNDDVAIGNVNDFENYLDDEMASQNIPALATLIFNGNNILHESYLGKSNIEQDILLENDHLFLLASVSKVITATALLQLYDDGLFNMDDNVSDYLPFDVAHPDYNRAITFRMLLTHTASIADNWDVIDEHYFYGEDSPVALAFFIENYLEPNGEHYSYYDNFYDFEPGTDYEYTNIGNALIGVLVEEISGMDFNSYCKQNIFEPLGMTNTFWKLNEINGTIAQPYDYEGNSNQAIGHYTNTDYPNGGLRSTARDLHKLLAAFAAGGTLNGFEVLKPATVANMVSAQISNINNDTGWHMFKLNNPYNLWGHDGGEQGVATIMTYNPATKVGAVVLCNQGMANLDAILVEAYKLGLDL